MKIIPSKPILKWNTLVLNINIFFRIQKIICLSICSQKLCCFFIILKIVSQGALRAVQRAPRARQLEIRRGPAHPRVPGAWRVLQGGDEVGGLRARAGPPLPLLLLLRGCAARLLHPLPQALRMLPHQVHRGRGGQLR